MELVVRLQLVTRHRRTRSLAKSLNNSHVLTSRHIGRCWPPARLFGGQMPVIAWEDGRETFTLLSDCGPCGSRFVER